jgi:hypothetical protein
VFFQCSDAGGVSKRHSFGKQALDFGVAVMRFGRRLIARRVGRPRMFRLVSNLAPNSIINCGCRMTSMVPRR